MRKILGAGLLVAASGMASAGEVVRWVDADGTTHFTDRALAQGNAQTVEVGAANGMDVPDASSVRSRQSRPSFIKISKAAKKNKDGWTGYQRRNRYNGRRYRR